MGNIQIECLELARLILDRSFFFLLYFPSHFIEHSAHKALHLFQMKIMFLY